MTPLEAATRLDLARLDRETRIENRAYARAQEQAKADPYQEYYCGCGNTATALEVAWFGQDCGCGQWRMAGVQATLRNPVTGGVLVTLQAGPK